MALFDRPAPLPEEAAPQVVAQRRQQTIHLYTSLTKEAPTISYSNYTDKNQQHTIDSRGRLTDWVFHSVCEARGCLSPSPSASVPQSMHQTRVSAACCARAHCVGIQDRIVAAARTAVMIIAAEMRKAAIKRT